MYAGEPCYAVSEITLVHEGRLRELPHFTTVPKELLELKGVALSGDGEPTLSPQFTEIVRGLPLYPL